MSNSEELNALADRYERFGYHPLLTQNEGKAIVSILRLAASLQAEPGWRRHAVADRRIANGDDFAGDCWINDAGTVCWTVVGTSPNVFPTSPVAEREHRRLDNDRQVFFYEQDFYVLSNFSAFTLNWKGWRFDTSEAAYHWEKYAHMNEVDIVGGHECHPCYVIRRAESAHAAFKIAEANRSARRGDWDNVKVGIMRDILRAKANQHEYVRRKLLATGDRELIEDSWRDDFWGWGPNKDGQNVLGKLWMEIRAELRATLTRVEATEPTHRRSQL